MQNILYIQTAIVPILMLAAIFFNSRREAFTLKQRLFLRCVVLTILVLIIDLAAWVLNGKHFTASLPLLYTLNILLYIVGVLISFEWLQYTRAVLVGGKPMKRRCHILVILPMLLFILLTLTSIANGLVFSIDAAGVYTRGPLFFVYIIVAFGYLLAAAGLSLHHARKSPTKSKRNECLTLSSFVVLPIVGAIIQAFGYGLSLIWPLTAISILIIYLSQVNQHISLDSLTGLNNRGQLDRFLLTKCTDSERTSSIFLVIMDVNGFKGINDTYGHVFGDKVLEYVANKLKKAFDETDAFLARYGGDEFAVVMEARSERELQAVLDRFTASLEETEKVLFDFSLSVSCGISEYSTSCNKGVEWFITSADMKMYNQKQERREKSAGSEEGSEEDSEADSEHPA